MRAVRFDEYGGPEVLHLSEVEQPQAGPDRVRVRVEAFSLNPMEYKIRSGAWSGGRPLTAPRGTARDVAGVVDQVGEGVEGFAVGDRVYGSAQDAAAEYAVLHAFAHIPRELSFTDAASLPMAVETAARTLDLVRAEPPALLLMDGAAGGVGTAAIQLAVARGYEVIGTASEANHDYLRSLGATPTTYGPGLPERVAALTDRRVDAAIDLQGKGVLPVLIEITGDPSHVITIVEFDAGPLGVQVTGGAVVHHAWYVLDEVARLIRDGAFRPGAVTVLPWTEIVRAHGLLEDGHTRGKLVLQVAGV
jgi:NADPH:quinone reductase-like Zn-dependent oxidoreductase